MGCRCTRSRMGFGELELTNYMNTNETYTAKGKYILTFRDAITNEVIKESTYYNVVCNVGKNAIAADLAGDSTYKAQVTYIAVGTGAGTPAATDTTLFTELARVANSFDGATLNVATIQGFFNAATGNGVLTNIGAFGNGSATQATASADTGILFSKSAITETKTSSQTLTVQFLYTIS